MGVALGAGAELAIGIGAHREHSACLGEHEGMGDPSGDLDHSVVDRSDERRHELAALVASSKLAIFIGAGGVEPALVIDHGCMLHAAAGAVDMSVGHVGEGHSHGRP